MQKKKGAVGAIIVAAGTGSRMGLGYNKVLADLCGRPVIDWTIRNFALSGLMDILTLVVNPQEQSKIEELCRPYRAEVDLRIVHGGERRQDSVYNALKALPETVEIVLIHDGARPFVDKSLLESSILKTRQLGAVCAGIPAKDTIKIVDGQKTVMSTPERSLLWQAQTPQTFRREIILEAYKQAFEKGIAGTDDASLAEKAGFKVTMLEGSDRNIKLTSKEDLILARHLIKTDNEKKSAF